MTPRLPAHYDHVGSFLRPLALLEAREQHAKGQISAAALRLALANGFELVAPLLHQLVFVDGGFVRRGGFGHGVCVLVGRGRSNVLWPTKRAILRAQPGRL